MCLYILQRKCPSFYSNLDYNDNGDDYGDENVNDNTVVVVDVDDDDDDDDVDDDDDDDDDNGDDHGDENVNDDDTWWSWRDWRQQW